MNELTSGRLGGYAPWLIGVSVTLIGVLATLGQPNWGALVLGAFVGYLAALYVASVLVEGRRRAVDRVATNLVYAAFVAALIPLISLLITTITQGVGRFDPTFFTSSMRNVVGAGGGAVHAIYGTLYVTGLAALFSVPLGLLAAIYLVEYGTGRLARAITFFVDVMTGIPSIVAGLFAYAAMALIFGPGTVNGFAGSVALSVLMIPVVVRATEELLRIVPNELREAAYALGVPKWRTIMKVVLPTAFSGIVAGIILAIARVIGETAPLMVAAGFTQSLNNNPFAEQMMTLPVFVYDSYAHPGTDVAVYTERAWAGALTLIVIVMLLNLIGRFVSAKFVKE